MGKDGGALFHMPSLPGLAFPFLFPSAEALGFDIAPLRGCRRSLHVRSIWVSKSRVDVYPLPFCLLCFQSLLHGFRYSFVEIRDLQVLDRFDWG